MDVIARPGLHVWLVEGRRECLATITVVRVDSCEVVDGAGLVVDCRFYPERPDAASGVYCYPRTICGIPVMASTVTVKGKGIKHA